MSKQPIDVYVLLEILECRFYPESFGRAPVVACSIAAFHMTNINERPEQEGPPITFRSTIRKHYGSLSQLGAKLFIVTIEKR